VTVRADPEPLAERGHDAGPCWSCPGFVDEHQTIRIEIELGIEPVPAPLRMSGRLCSAACAVFFFERQAAAIEEDPKRRPSRIQIRSAASLSSISLMVMSGVVSTSPRM
jgi:hypothetical protein